MRWHTDRRILLIVAFLIFGVLLWQSHFSLATYVRIGMQVRDVSQGDVAALTSEYPPLASSVFYAFQQHPFGLSFAACWKILILLLLFGSLLYARGSTDAGPVFALSMLLCVPLFGTELLFARYDIFILFFLFLAWTASGKRQPAAAGLALGIATALKIVPLLLLPFLWIRLDAAQRRRLLGGFLGGIALGLLLPILLMGWDRTMENILYLVSFHGARGIQIESTWSGLLLLFAAITQRTVTIDHRQGAFELVALPAFARIATAVTVAGLAFLLWMQWRRRRVADDASSPLSPLSLPLLWAFLATPVLSPQYFVWILPLMLAEGLQRFTERKVIRTCVFLLLTAMCAALTHWIFPILYYDLIHLALGPILILNARNALVGILLWMMGRNRP